jgi:hypothetical protein
MAKARTLSPAVVSAGGLVGGFAAARYSGRRELGGAVFAAAGLWCGREWRRASGTVPAAAMAAVYAAAMGGSHPLAKRIGAWPAVLAVSVATAAASAALPRRT